MADNDPHVTFDGEHYWCNVTVTERSWVDEPEEWRTHRNGARRRVRPGWRRLVLDTHICGEGPYETVTEWEQHERAEPDHQGPYRGAAVRKTGPLGV